MIYTIDGFEVKGSGQTVWELASELGTGKYVPTRSRTGNAGFASITNRNRCWKSLESCQKACDEINLGVKTVFDFNNGREKDYGGWK